ncbi:pyridoxamine 5'-phosphate oxidase family protein, partial [Arthrobacter monumenti]
MPENTDVQKVVELINDSNIGMLTTINEDQQLVSRPLAVQQVESDGDMWFFTHRDTTQVAHAQTDPRVNISFSQRDAWVSVSGEAQVVEDTAKAKELWNAAVEAWFPDGPETPGLVFIRVNAESAEYWDTPGGSMATVVKFIKSKTTGGHPNVGR